MVKLNERDDVNVIMINVGDSVSTVEDLFDKEKIDLPVVFDEEGKVAQTFLVRGFPTLAYIDGDGVFRGFQFGYMEHDDMEKNILSVIEKSKKDK